MAIKRYILPKLWVLKNIFIKFLNIVGPTGSCYYVWFQPWEISFRRNKVPDQGKASEDGPYTTSANCSVISNKNISVIEKSNS